MEQERRPLRSRRAAPLDSKARAKERNGFPERRVEGGWALGVCTPVTPPQVLLRRPPRSERCCAFSTTKNEQKMGHEKGKGRRSNKRISLLWLSTAVKEKQNIFGRM